MTLSISSKNPSHLVVFSVVVNARPAKVICFIMNIGDIFDNIRSHQIHELQELNQSLPNCLSDCHYDSAL